MFDASNNPSAMRNVPLAELRSPLKEQDSASRVWLPASECGFLEEKENQQ
jgi:hypothetical protein